MPDPEVLPHDDVTMPFFVIGDEAFGLREWLMKPFPCTGITRRKRIFNYRLSRARRCIECAFGILMQR